MPNSKNKNRKIKIATLLKVATELNTVLKLVPQIHVKTICKTKLIQEINEASVKFDVDMISDLSKNTRIGLTLLGIIRHY